MPGIFCATLFGSPLPDPRVEPNRHLDLLEGSVPTDKSYTSLNNALFGARTFNDNCGVANSSSGKLLAFHGIVAPCSLPDGNQDSPVPERLLIAFETDGIDAITNLNGHFAVVLWDETEQSLTVVTDPLGTERIYAWRAGDRLLIASQIKAIAVHPDFDPAIDEAGLVQLVRCGHLIDKHTLFRDVELLPHGTITTWTATGRTDNRYWLPPFSDGHTATMSDDDYADELARLAVQAHQRLVPRGSTILLSAGYDSRTIACAGTRALGSDAMNALTLGADDTNDVVYSKRIAQQLGIAHRSAPIPEDFFARYAERGVWRTEGLAIGHTCWRSAADDSLAKHAPPALLHGLGGDNFQGVTAMYDDLLEESRPDAALERYFKTHPRPVMTDEELPQALRASLADNAHECVRGTITRSVADIPAEHPVNRLDCILTFMSDRRYYSVTSEYCSPSTQVLFPFFDRDFHAFAMQLPVRLRYKARLLTRMYARHFPEISAIPMARNSMPVAATPLTNMMHRMRSWAQYRLLPAATLGAVRPKSRAPYVHYVDWLRTANRTYVEELLAQTHYLEDYFNIDHVRQSTADVMEGRSNDFGKVYNYATIVLFQKLFRDGQLKAPSND